MIEESSFSLLSPIPSVQSWVFFLPPLPLSYSLPSRSSSAHRPAPHGPTGRRPTGQHLNEVLPQHKAWHTTPVKPYTSCATTSVAQQHCIRPFPPCSYEHALLCSPFRTSPCSSDLSPADLCQQPRAHCKGPNVWKGDRKECVILGCSPEAYLSLSTASESGL